MAQFGGDQFAGELAKIVPALVEVISDPDSRDPRNVNATENAISAVTKIMKYNSSQINLDEMIPLWFTWLPVIEDSDEAPHVYGYMCDLIEQNNQHVLGESCLNRTSCNCFYELQYYALYFCFILGPNNSNIPRIINIIAEAFFREAIDPSKPEGYRMSNIVRQVQSNESFFQSVVQSLTPELQQALHVALHTPPST